MTVTCPEGHRSEASDYCDTCGTPIEGGPGGGADPGQSTGARPTTPGPVLPPSAEGSVLDLDPDPAPTLTCPHCGALNVADALFCEACGYDFTTGAAPLGSPVVPEDEQEDEGEGALDLGPDGDDAAHGEVEEPAEHEEPAADEARPDEVPAAQQEGIAEVGADEPGPEPGREPEPARSPAGGRDAVAAHAKPRHTPPSRALSDTWVVEVWVDPDWYAVQDTAEACPSPGLPDIVVVRRNVVLVGRPSGSLGVRPDVDSGGDSAVSRRHAQLTSDGSRWWIEDLGSSNGTYVGSVGEPLPTEPIRTRVEIDRDDRIYVGAWTRLVLRQATASEEAGQG